MDDTSASGPRPGVAPGIERHEAAGLFARQSTGLVRSVSTADAVLYNFSSAGNVGLALVFSVTFALAVFPAGNLYEALFLVVPITIAYLLSAALLTAAMPRSGGDYVYVSRILGPRLGFLSSWAVYIGAVLAGFNAWIFSVALLSPALAGIGQLQNSDLLLRWSTWTASPTGSFVVGSVFSLLCFAVVGFLDIKSAIRIMSVAILVALAGLVVSVIMLALADKEAFRTSFDALATSFTGQKDAYSSLEAVGATQIASSGTSGFVSTLGMMPLMALFLFFGAWMTYIAGEMKQATSRSRQVTTVLVPLGLNVVMMVLALLLTERLTSHNFLTGASYSFTLDPANYPLPFAPVPFFFATLTTDSVVLRYLIAGSALLWSFAIYITIGIQATRQIFAWSFDRLIPTKLAAVSPRTHTPIYGAILIFFFLEISLAASSYGDFILKIIGPSAAVQLIMFFLVSVTAIVFPYRWREYYEASSVKWEIGGLPIISIAGVISAIGVVVIAVEYWRFPVLGVAGGIAVALLLVTFGGALLISYGARWIRKRQGVDLDLTYKEIPVE